MEKNRLNKSDLEYLSKLPGLSISLIKKLNMGLSGLPSISPDEFDSLHDACVSLLQVEGFDENYGLTPVGQRLEELIDKIYFC